MTIAKTNKRTELTSLWSILSNKLPALNNKKAAAGFDGFIDTIIRVLQSKSPDGNADYFKTTSQFAAYINAKHGSSFSLEVEERVTKPGGNMPIMANAMGTLGIPVKCIGAFGYPTIHPGFSWLSRNCELHSFTQPGTSTAIEFTDGKMMLGNMATLHTDDWEFIKNRLGLATLTEIFTGVDLICLVNWSEIDASTDIWRGVLNDIVLQFPPGARPYCFADLSDCSKRSKDQILEALEVLREIGKHTSLQIGLNRNEAKLVYQTLFDKPAVEDLAEISLRIYESLKPQQLLVHTTRSSYVITPGNMIECESFHTDSPALSTGAGDNFNAGYCAGLLLNLEAHHTLLLANLVAGYYVRHGQSPDVAGLNKFIQELQSSE